jgi:hypothetical protein
VTSFSLLLCRSVLEELKLRWEAKLESSDVYNAEEGIVDDGKEYAANSALVDLSAQSCDAGKSQLSAEPETQRNVMCAL